MHRLEQYLAACLCRLNEIINNGSKRSHANVTCKTQGTYSHGSKSCSECCSAKELMDGSHGSPVADCYFWKQVHIKSHQVLQSIDTVSCKITHQNDHCICNPSLWQPVQPDQTWQSTPRLHRLNCAWLCKLRQLQSHVVTFRMQGARKSRSSPVLSPLTKWSDQASCADCRNLEWHQAFFVYGWRLQLQSLR